MDGSRRGRGRDIRLGLIGRIEGGGRKLMNMQMRKEGRERGSTYRG